MLGLRIAQLVLSIIVLGLTAYGMLLVQDTKALLSAKASILTPLPHSRQLVVWLLACERTRPSQLPPLLLNMVASRPCLPHCGTAAIFGDEAAPQVCRPGRRILDHALLVRRLHRAGGLPERSGLLWTRLLVGESCGCLRRIRLVGSLTQARRHCSLIISQAMLRFHPGTGSDACHQHARPNVR